MINKRFFILALISSLLVVAHNNGKENHSKPLLVATIPKSGTNFLSKLVRKMSGKKPAVAANQTKLNQKEIDSLDWDNFYNTHAVCSPHNFEVALQNKLKLILLIRDPRAVLLSWAHWLKKHPLTKEQFRNYSLHELISELIINYNFHMPHNAPFTIASFFDSYIGWQKYPFKLMVRFEDIIGLMGGGDATIQEREFQNIARFLDISLSKDKIAKIAHDVFGDSPTFRSGRIDSWKEELTRQQKDNLKPLIGDLLITLGYEKDLNW